MLPCYISTDENGGDEREFLEDAFPDAQSQLIFIITALLGIIVFRMNRDADEARKKKERKELVKAYKREQKLAKMGGMD